MSDGSLKLESYIFRIIEGQARLFEYLDQKSQKWNWEVDLATGKLSFVDGRTKKAILTCPAFLIGSFSTGDMSFFWGWANSSTTTLPTVAERYSRLRQTAREQQEESFLYSEPFEMESKEAAQELAIITASALDAFTFYAGGYAGGIAYLAVDPFPEIAATPSAATPADVLVKIRVLTMAIMGAPLATAALPFEHRSAVIAYLGEPVSTDGNVLTFPVGKSKIQVTFDARGRIADIQSTLSSEDMPAELPAPDPEPNRRPGFLSRLFRRN